MKKDTIKNEMNEEIELNEEVKTEELSEETLETVDGGCLVCAAAFLAGVYFGSQMGKRK